MKITETLNLAIDCNGVTIFHTPISRDVFDTNYRIFAATKAALAGKGTAYQVESAPQIASLALKDEAQKEELDARSVLSEIKRLSTVLVPSADGYDYLPIDTAINRGMIDAEDWKEAESSLVFFTCHFVMALRANRRRVSEIVSTLINGTITSLALMDYASSLRTSTTPEFGIKAESSVPV